MSVPERLKESPRPGHPPKFDYRRHGTLALLAGMHVTTGKMTPLISETGTEEDVASWLEHRLNSNPCARGWHFIADNLNTHRSESAVRVIAAIEGMPPEKPGIKGKSGILKNRGTWSAYLSNPSHKREAITGIDKWCSFLSYAAVVRIGDWYYITLFFDNSVVESG